MAMLAAPDHESRRAKTGSLTPPSGVWGHANRFGGFSSGRWDGDEHTNRWGGSTEHAWGEGVEHTNVYGGTTEARYGEGAVHTTPYGATAYVPPAHVDAVYPYHPPATVNVYGAGCYNCGGWAVAGAAAGAVVGAATATAVASADNRRRDDQRV